MLFALILLAKMAAHPIVELLSSLLDGVATAIMPIDVSGREPWHIRARCSERESGYVVMITPCHSKG